MKKSLLILCVYPTSTGYPNIKYRLQDLEQSNAFDITTIHRSVWAHNIANHSANSLLKQCWAFLTAHCKVFTAYLNHPDKRCVYIPYPAIFIAAVLSLLPKRLRPKHLVLDAFISLYDTVVVDRNLLSKKNILAKTLYLLERRAYKNCATVIVDTPQNAQYLSQLFVLPMRQFKSIPLSTSEKELTFKPYRFNQSQSTYTVLFVGTLIPLHGIDVILDAIALLASNPKIAFKIIGDGQLAPLISRFLESHTVNLTWIKTWYSEERILAEVEAADICLSIFGTSAKAQRVIPFKHYLYAASGRTMITADTLCMQDMLATQQHPICKLIPAGSSSALAVAIEALVSEPKQLEIYGKNARDHYQSTLTNQVALIQLIKLLTPAE